VNNIKKFIRAKMPALVKLSHFLRGMLAYYLFGMAPKKLKVIGITGTNGKTTTCYLTASILEEAGFKIGMATTTNFKVGSKEWINKTNMTTMSPFVLQRLMRDMVRAGCQYAIIETTSHAIKQYRNWGINYLAVGMTNVTHEHLDYHKTFNEYLKAKIQLFQGRPKISVVNADDPSCDKFIRFTTGKLLTYSKEKRADITARKILPAVDGAIFTLVTPTVQTTVDFHLPGDFNVSNALCAASICYGLQIEIANIKKGLEGVLNVPGRLEKIDKGQDFKVIIDYAHSPDALEKLYSTLKPNVKGNMIAVLGSCGDRDKSKRPIMGSIAGHFADIVIITDEEPYTEDPREIIEQVASGVPRGRKGKKITEDKDFFKIDDRRKAIRKALQLADRNDLVVITGMGAQEYRVKNSKKIPWSERKVVGEELEQLNVKE
jgi:UDP-N-acetylmuramoyl-L-alanyl-D-glutamate--2,6-diaminopimelate ligase